MKRETLIDLIGYGSASCCGNCVESDFNAEDRLWCNKYDFAVYDCNICDGFVDSEDV